MELNRSMYPSMTVPSVRTPRNSSATGREAITMPFITQDNTSSSCRTSTDTQCFPGAPCVSKAGAGKRNWYSGCVLFFPIIPARSGGRGLTVPESSASKL